METLFLKLLNLSLTASWLVLAVLLVRLVFRRAPRWIFCLLWGLVGLRLLCPVSIESVFSLIPSAQPVPESILTNQVPHIQSGIGAIDAMVNPVLAGTLAPAPGASVNPAQVWAFVCSIVWLIGMAGILLYGVFSSLRLWARLRTATRLRGSIFQSDSINSPFVFGLFRPRIYVPYSIPEGDLPYVLAHEEAHIRRRDHWWKPLGFVLLAVYWFNPLLWAAYVLLCRDIEVACDEKVIREMGEEARTGYTVALLRCSVRPALLAACPLAFGEVGVKERITRVMRYHKPTVILVVLALAVTAVAAVCLLTDPKSPGGSSSSGGSADILSTPGPSSGANLSGSSPEGSSPDPGSTTGLLAWVVPQDESDIWSSPDNATMELPEIPGTVFHFSSSKIIAAKADGTETALISGMPIWNAYFQDINGDGIRELCATTSFGSGMIDNRILCWESTTDTVYTLVDRGVSDYTLRVQNGILYADQRRYPSGELMATGRLILQNGVLGMEATDPDVLADLLLTPGNTFVSWECLYLTPYSSAIPTGDSGLQYQIREDGFVWIPQERGDLPEGAAVIPAQGEPLDEAALGDHFIPVSDWSWQAFPWTQEEWEDMMMLVRSDSISDLPSLVQDLRYLPLGDEFFLLFADGDLLIAKTFFYPDGSPQIWSIFSLVYQETMGGASWLCRQQADSSERPTFSFLIEDGTSIFATCSAGQLIDWDSTVPEQGALTGVSLVFPSGHLVTWYPFSKDGTFAPDASIRFSFALEDGETHFGTLYLHSDGGSPDVGDVLFHASLVGTGLHLGHALPEDGQGAHAVVTMVS